MNDSPDWPSAFLAFSVLLGEPWEAAVATLGDATTPQSARLSGVLASSSRAQRAHAIARVATAVMVEIDRGRLA
jgi:hypothetical protein